MALDLKVSVRQQITQLRKKITQKSRELTSLKGELKRHGRVYRLLGGNRGVKRRPKRGSGGKRRVDWKAVLKALPNSFSIGEMAKRGVLRKKSRVYLRQIVVRWTRQGKIKRIGRGKYQKA